MLSGCKLTVRLLRWPAAAESRTFRRPSRQDTKRTRNLVRKIGKLSGALSEPEERQEAANGRGFPGNYVGHWKRFSNTWLVFGVLRWWQRVIREFRVRIVLRNLR